MVLTKLESSVLELVHAMMVVKNKPIISKNAIPVVIPRDRVHDIDTFEDWQIAEKMFQIINKKKL